MGIFDEIGNEDDDQALLAAEQALVRRHSPWREMDGQKLLQAERAGGSAMLVRLGAFGAELSYLSTAQREAWSLFNLDRIMRRILASADLDPTNLLPHLIGGSALAAGHGSEAASARFLLCALLPLVADVGGVDASMVARVLRRIRPVRVEQRECDAWQEEVRAIDDVTDIGRRILKLLEERMGRVDPLFAVTDLLATYGGALHGLPLHHWPDNSGATDAAMILESFRQAASLPPLLSLARRALPDGSLYAAFDLATAAGFARRLPPAPFLSGLIRKDLFRRDLHYPADLGCLIASIGASLALARRDLRAVQSISSQISRASARVQTLSVAILTCYREARPSALAVLTGSSWQGVDVALAPLRRTGLLQRDESVWQLSTSRLSNAFERYSYRKDAP